MASEVRYQVSRSGKVFATYDSAEMIAKVALGEVRLSDHYWTKGMAGWEKVSSHPEWIRHAPAAKGSGRERHAQVKRGSYVPSDSMICTQCGTVGSVRHTKGSFVMEILLWLFFCFPGLIYSIWRITTRGNVCPSCKSDKIVSAISPVGKKLISEQGRR